MGLESSYYTYNLKTIHTHIHSHKYLLYSYDFVFPTIILSKFKRHVTYRHGFPDQLIKDNGTKYTNCTIQEFTESKGIELVKIPPSRPCRKSK